MAGLPNRKIVCQFQPGWNTFELTSRTYANYAGNKHDITSAVRVNGAAPGEKFLVTEADIGPDKDGNRGACATISFVTADTGMIVLDDSKLIQLKVSNWGS